MTIERIDPTTSPLSRSEVLQLARRLGKNAGRDRMAVVHILEKPDHEFILADLVTEMPDLRVYGHDLHDQRKVVITVWRNGRVDYHLLGQMVEGSLWESVALAAIGRWLAQSGRAY